MALGAVDAGSHVESLTVEGVWLAVGAAAVDTVPEKGVNPVVQWLQLRQVRGIVFGSHVAAIDALSFRTAADDVSLAHARQDGVGGATAHGPPRTRYVYVCL